MSILAQPQYGEERSGQSKTPYAASRRGGAKGGPGEESGRGRSRGQRGRPIVICASGPSFTAGQAEKVRGKAFVIVINTTYKLVPWADVLYGADAQWWNYHRPDFYERKISVDDSTTIPSVEIWKYEVDGVGLSFEPGLLYVGRPLSSSGYQAINLAVILGETELEDWNCEIILLGYDMKFGPNGEIHHHGAHPLPLNNPLEEQLQGYRQSFEAMLPDLRNHGITVWNCTPDSALKCFPKVGLDHVFK